MTEELPGEGRDERLMSALGGSLELPERGTGARAARRAAQAAAAQQEVAERDLARRFPGFRRREPELDAVSTGRRPPRRAEDAAPASSPEDPASAPTRRREAPSRRSPDRRWLAGFAAALAVCVLAAAGLLVLGLSTLRDSRAGRTVVSAQPDEPGFEGFLESTPTLAVRVVHEGLLEAVYVLSLGRGDAGGGVLLIPASTSVGELGTLDVSHAFGASEAEMRGAVEIVVGVGLDELVTVDDARWADLVAPVAPVRIDNPDASDGFAAGPLDLAPEEVGPYLRSRVDGEPEMARLVRHEIFFEAWLDQIAEAGEGAVPGELDAGLGRFVRGLAAGEHQVMTMPVTEVTDGSGRVEHVVDADARGGLVLRLIPYPRGTANAPRTLVRLLDGTGQDGHVAQLAPQVIASDSSIVVIGNADRFDYETTQIRYHQPQHRGAAERIRRDLGEGEVIEDVRPIDSFDVTIVLGTDL